jgi:hypothetical protein
VLVIGSNIVIIVAPMIRSTSRLLYVPFQVVTANSLLNKDITFLTELLFAI